MINLNDTIAAISTPPGKGGVALIRVSGKDAYSIVEKCFHPTYKSDVKLKDREPRKAIRGDIYQGNDLIDDGLVFLFPSPGSYTGEDTVEITCHGGILVTRTVLESVLLAGARLAEPGEFTKRAYLNGRLSLTEAESIGNLLEASNLAQIKLSSRVSRSHLSIALEEIHNELILMMSSLYATIDYPEEDLGEYSNEDMIRKLEEILQKTNKLLSTYKTGRTISDGISTVICGKPNVGKSSLYNTLCHEDAAIVTDIAGTTRDVLQTKVSLGNVTLNLFDTAGIHEASDAVEVIGVNRSREKMLSSELVLLVLDGSSKLDSEDMEILSDLKEAQGTIIALKNKCDLGKVDFELPSYITSTLEFSCKDPDLEKLESIVSSLFLDGTIQIGEDAILSSARQYTSLKKAYDLMKNTKVSLQSGLPADVASSEIELALGELSNVDGRAVSEEIVSSIFSHFCIGK